MSMPDTWEYPWFAAWDLAFHCVPFALIDPDFAKDQLLLLGRESDGVPTHVHEAADARIRVPMRPNARSLNVALAAAIVLAEALRQTGSLPR